ncbi:acyltransferase domain-containing protein, partial [Lipingzhangella sp. LS1_29]
SGSVKSNLGHTQAAAGMAGMIKMIEAIRHAHLPCTLHVDEPTPHLDWSRSGLALLTRARDWPDMGRPRRAAVSAFGISGTNAHLVLEQAPAGAVGAGDVGPGQSVPEAGQLPAAPVPWVLSAHTPTALHTHAQQLHEHLTLHPSDARAVGHALATSRAHMDHRAVVLHHPAEDRPSGMAGLRTLAETAAAPQAPGVVLGRAVADPRPVFVFGGQGAQWVGMAAGLVEQVPVFAERIAACERALAPWVDWSLTGVLAGSDPACDLGRVEVVQPALWAVMVSLAGLWRDLGVEPAAVVGHSQGEIAAATVAGALSVAEAARIVALRSQAIAAHAPAGAMVAVHAPVEQVQEYITGHVRSDLHIAAVNSPESTIVAGDPAAADVLLEHYGSQAQAIDVSYASHTPHIDTLHPHLTTTLTHV